MLNLFLSCVRFYVQDKVLNPQQTGRQIPWSLGPAPGSLDQPRPHVSEGHTLHLLLCSFMPLPFAHSTNSWDVPQCPFLYSASKIKLIFQGQAQKLGAQ